LEHGTWNKVQLGQSQIAGGPGRGSQYVDSSATGRYDSDHFLLRREQERKSIPMIVRALTTA